MAFDRLDLPGGVNLPFPPDSEQSFINESFALAMKPIYEDAFRRNCHAAPSSPAFRLYKNCMLKMFHVEEDDNKSRQTKIESLLMLLNSEVHQAKRRFLKMFLGYNQMIKDNDAEYKSCRKKSVSNVQTFKELVTIQRKQTKANHSLLYIKDAIEEALDTYKDAETFLKEATKYSMWESPERMYNRIAKLAVIREELQRLERKEIDACQNTINEMYAIQQKSREKHTILMAKARYLARLIQDADVGALKLEKEEVLVRKMNERAWRDYSIINMTIFDLTRGLIELCDLNPRLLEGSLKERFDLIRREHWLNKEVVRRWGERRRVGDREQEAEVGPVFAEARTARLRAEWERKVARLREVVARYRGKPLPEKFHKYLTWMRRRNLNLPPVSQVWDYLSQLAEPEADLHES